MTGSPTARFGYPTATKLEGRDPELGKVQIGSSYSRSLAIGLRTRRSLQDAPAARVGEHSITPVP